MSQALRQELSCSESTGLTTEPPRRHPQASHQSMQLHHGLNIEALVLNQKDIKTLQHYHIFIWESTFQASSHFSPWPLHPFSCLSEKIFRYFPDVLEKFEIFNTPSCPVFAVWAALTPLGVVEEHYQFILTMCSISWQLHKKPKWGLHKRPFSENWRPLQTRWLLALNRNTSGWVILKALLERLIFLYGALQF